MTSPYTTRDVTLLAFHATLFGLWCNIRREGMHLPFYTMQTPLRSTLRCCATQSLQIRQTSSLSMSPVLPFPPAL